MENIQIVIDDFKHIFIRLREQSGDNNTKMAKKLEMSKTYLSLIESGERRCTYDIVIKLLKKYDVDKETRKEFLHTYGLYNRYWEIMNLYERDRKSIIRCHELTKQISCKECKHKEYCSEYKRMKWREKNGIYSVR